MFRNHRRWVQDFGGKICTFKGSRRKSVSISNLAEVFLKLHRQYLREICLFVLNLKLEYVFTLVVLSLWIKLNWKWSTLQKYDISAVFNSQLTTSYVFSC